MDIQHKVTLTDTEIVSLVNFIEYWNDVQQADQDLLDNICLLYTSPSPRDS